MNLTEFFDEAERMKLRVSVSDTRDPMPHSLSNEALFQIPLLAMAVLAISKSRSKPELPEIGQLVGECLGKV